MLSVLQPGKLIDAGIKRHIINTIMIVLFKNNKEIMKVKENISKFACVEVK